MRELNQIELDQVSGGDCPCPGGGTDCPRDPYPEAGIPGQGMNWTINCNGILYMNGGPVGPAPLQQ